MDFKDIKNAKELIFNYLSSIFSAKSCSEFLNDDRGGLILPFNGKSYNDEDWLKYQCLEVDETVEKIKPDYLPFDFCNESCRLVDEFRRKTVNESDEWMLYFDYKTGDVIYCWEGREGKCGGNFEMIHLHGRNVASLHSHPRGYYSFPSPENFDILENEFEDYEVITSANAMWIVEFRGHIDKNSRRRFQHNLGKNMSEIMSIIRLTCKDYDIDDVSEDVMSNYLLCEMDKRIQGISLILIKKEFF